MKRASVVSCRWPTSIAAFFGNALVALPFGVYGGVAASDAEAFTALENEAQQLARQ